MLLPPPTARARTSSVHGSQQGALQGSHQQQHHAGRGLSSPDHQLQQRQPASCPPPSEQQQQQQQQEGSAACPVLLVHRAWGAGLAGWSVVLPQGWVRPFWQALAFTGELQPAGVVLCAVALCETHRVQQGWWWLALGGGEAQPTELLLNILCSENDWPCCIKREM